MKTIQIGASDLRVPAMGVGTMAWSNSSMWGYGARLKQPDARPPFEASLEAGLRFFDTAEIYGFGFSERVLGALVKDVQVPLAIATKYAPLPTRFTGKAVVNALAKSLGRLGLDQVDLYQIHFPAPWARIETLMAGLAQSVEEGKTRWVGVSNFSAAQMRRAHEALARHGIPLVSNQVEYSLIRRDPEDNGVLQACRELDITLIAYSPLGRGVLSGKFRPESGPGDARRFYGQFRKEALSNILPLLRALEEIGAAHGGRSPSQVALNWCARQPGVLPIPGAKDADQARQNADSINWEMTDEEATLLDRLSSESSP